MTNPYLSHPDEEALERFLLQRSGEEELEVVETHILACDSCVARLERLETQIADLRLALSAVREQQAEATVQAKPSFWQRWLTIPNLSWAGAACAALVLAAVIVPSAVNSVKHGPAAKEAISACAASDVNLAACRGQETALLPAHRPLNLKVDAADIASGPVDVQIVNADGSERWHGQSTVADQIAKISVPAISQPGTYLLRLYAPSAGAERELLREFRFEVK